MTALLIAALLAACRDGAADAPMVDVDGDGVVDKWRRFNEASAAMDSGHEWELVLSKSRETVSGEITGQVGSMLDFHDVPAELLGPGREKARFEVERRLFARFCDAPDPSMQWLLDRSALRDGARWHEGDTPAMPDAYYTIAVTDPPSRDKPKGGMTWISYKAQMHHGSAVVPPLKGFELIATTPSRKLLRSFHGLVVVDTVAKRHAWAWVTRGVWKLRFPSVCPSAQVKGARAIVPFDIRDPAAEDEGTNLEVDLVAAVTKRHDFKADGVLGCDRKP